MTESRYFPFIPDVIISAAEQFRMKGWKSEDKMEKILRWLQLMYTAPLSGLTILMNFKKVTDQILKFAPTVPAEKTYFYYDIFRERLKGKVEPTTSGHGSIDLIVPGCHKASGLKRLVERWGISPEQCAAFGDGGNDIEMLNYCGYSYAMENAPQNVKDAAKYICPPNEEDGVLVTLEKIFSVENK